MALLLMATMCAANTRYRIASIIQRLASIWAEERLAMMIAPGHDQDRMRGGAGAIPMIAIEGDSEDSLALLAI